MPSEKTPSLSEEILKGTKWYVAMRWSIKGLGFISSAVLARLLIPEDFGLVAMVMVIFGLVSLLFDFGVNWALIQNNKATDAHFHTAWTIRLLQALVISILLAMLSPFIADFYDDVRMEIICQIMALATLIRGFENIGTIKLQKEMKFAKDFLYNVAPKFFSIFVTISLAFYYRTYMALVVTIVMGNLIVVITSYLMVNFRPKFSFEKISDIWGFSQWILVRNIAQYISLRGDMIFLSVLTTPTKIGYYKWGSELSSLTISEIQNPFTRVLLPGLAKIKDDHDRLIGAYLKALGMMTLAAVPIALGFGSVASELIPIFLGGGDKWMPVVPILEGLVFYAMTTSMYSISGNLLTVSGNVKYTAYMFWVQALVTMAILYPAFNLAGLTGVAYSRAASGILMFFVVSLLTVKKCQVDFSQIISVIWRHVLSGLVMYVILIYGFDLWDVEKWIKLICKIITGATLYVSILLGLWWLSGKPDSAELALMNRVIKKIPF